MWLVQLYFLSPTVLRPKTMNAAFKSKFKTVFFFILIIFNSDKKQQFLPYEFFILLPTMKLSSVRIAVSVNESD